jgi:hypothetical protein
MKKSATSATKKSATKKLAAKKAPAKKTASKKPNVIKGAEPTDKELVAALQEGAPTMKKAGKKAFAVQDPKAIARLTKGREVLTMLQGKEVGPVAAIRYLAHKTQLVRREVLILAAEFGINKHTANRQFQESRSGKVACPDLKEVK